MKYIIISLVFLFVGCGGGSVVMPKPLYAWGDYQIAQIKYKNSSKNKKELMEYEKFLKKMINQDKIPPSICSEYAMILVKLDKKDEARDYFLKEITLYPESKVFIENSMKKIYGDNQ